MPVRRRSLVETQLFGCMLGVLACPQPDETTPNAERPEPPLVMDNCENDVASDSPCPGLVPRCTPTPPAHPQFVDLVALTDCVGEHLREAAIIDVLTQPSPGYAPGFQFKLESGCSVLVAVANSPDRIPPWSWMTLGQQLDVELWWAGGVQRGGSSVWLILRSPDASDLLLTHYQTRWQLIEDGTVGALLGIDLAILDPRCEEFSDTVLYHFHPLHFGAELSSAVLDLRQSVTLDLSNGERLRVQHDGTWFTHGHLVPVGYPIYDVDWGPSSRFSAWPEE